MRKEASLNIVSKQQSQSQSQSQIENNKRGNEGLILFLRKLDVPQHNQRLSFTIRKVFNNSIILNINYYKLFRKRFLLSII